MTSRTSEMVAKVDPAHALDQKALLAYASANVPGFPLHPSDFTVSQVPSISLLLFLSLSLLVFIPFFCGFYSSGTGNPILRIWWKWDHQWGIRWNVTFWGRSHRGSCFSLLTPLIESFRFFSLSQLCDKQPKTKLIYIKGCNFVIS